MAKFLTHLMLFSILMTMSEPVGCALLAAFIYVIAWIVGWFCTEEQE